MHLLVDFTLRLENCEMDEVIEIVWMLSSKKFDDGLTKAQVSPTLNQLMENDKVSVGAKVWAERSNI